MSGKGSLLYKLLPTKGKIDKFNYNAIISVFLKRQ